MNNIHRIVFVVYVKDNICIIILLRINGDLFSFIFSQGPNININNNLGTKHRFIYVEIKVPFTLQDVPRSTPPRINTTTPGILNTSLPNITLNGSLNMTNNYSNRTAKL